VGTKRWSIKFCDDGLINYLICLHSWETQSFHIWAPFLYWWNFYTLACSCDRTAFSSFQCLYWPVEQPSHFWASSLLLLCLLDTFLLVSCSAHVNYILSNTFEESFLFFSLSLSLISRLTAPFCLLATWLYNTYFSRSPLVIGADVRGDWRSVALYLKWNMKNKWCQNSLVIYLEPASVVFVLWADMCLPYGVCDHICAWHSWFTAARRRCLLCFNHAWHSR